MPSREVVSPHQVALALRCGTARMPQLQARVVCALAETGAADANIAALARQLGVHRATLHRALAVLRRKGWLLEEQETVAVERTVIELRVVRRLTVVLPRDAAWWDQQSERRRAG